MEELSFLGNKSWVQTYMEVTFSRSDKFASSLKKREIESASSQVIDVAVHQQSLQVVSDVTIKQLINITSNWMTNLLDFILIWCSRAILRERGLLETTV